MDGYIYICYERELQLLNLPIYKIGRTRDIYQRIHQYKKYSIVISTFYCTEHVLTEKDLIKIFTNKFKLCKNIGSEYFTGDLIEMQETILQYIKENKRLKYSLPNNSIVELFENNNLQKLNIIENIAQNLNIEELTTLKNIFNKIIHPLDKQIEVNQIEDKQIEVNQIEDDNQIKDNQIEVNQIEDNEIEVNQIEILQIEDNKIEVNEIEDNDIELHYMCARCGYDTIKISSMKNHLSKKKECKDLLLCGLSANKLLRNYIQFKCNLCDKSCDSLRHKLHHEYKCKLEIENIKLLEENNSLQKAYKKSLLYIK